MVHAYTQFVAGFEFGSIFWLLYSMLLYLYLQAMQKQPVAAVETTSGTTREPIDASAAPGFTHQGALTEQIVRNESRDPALTSTQPSVAEGGVKSEQITRLRQQVETLSMRRARALAKALDQTDVRIVGYGSMTLDQLITELTSHDRLQYIENRKIDIPALQEPTTVGKHKKSAAMLTH